MSKFIDWRESVRRCRKRNEEIGKIRVRIKEVFGFVKEVYGMTKDEKYRYEIIAKEFNCSGSKVGEVARGKCKENEIVKKVCPACKIDFEVVETQREYCSEECYRKIMIQSKGESKAQKKEARSGLLGRQAARRDIDRKFSDMMCEES